MVVDFNSYFASVEQQEQPALRGRPVAVVPMMADTTCAIAASYEAKRFGVKTGTLVREAKRLSRDLVLVEARHELYVRYHHELIKAVDSCMHVEKVLSIDEMLCPLTGRWRERDEAIALAHCIKRVIATQVGECLCCSIGIAPNPFLAKTASDMQKPDSLVVIAKNDLPHILHGLKLRDLCGIGGAMEERRRAGMWCRAPKPAAVLWAIRTCSRPRSARTRRRSRCCTGCCKRRRCGCGTWAIRGCAVGLAEAHEPHALERRTRVHGNGRHARLHPRAARALEPPSGDGCDAARRGRQSFPPPRTHSGDTVAFHRRKNPHPSESRRGCAERAFRQTQCVLSPARTAR